MRLLALVGILLAAMPARPAGAGRAAPALDEYLMPRDAEVRLALSAAPDRISARATVQVLTRTGYEVARQGDNGFVCLVMRGWTGPTYTPQQLRDLVYDASIRAPICFDPEAARTVWPYYELRSRLGMEGRSPDEIAHGVEAALTSGKLAPRPGVSFAYMFSADQRLGAVGHWHPHMMVFAPYYTPAMLGDNPFTETLPFVTDDAGTPFTVVVIPVDDGLAVKAERHP
jgi:hypothetical protein